MRKFKIVWGEGVNKFSFVLNVNVTHIAIVLRAKINFSIRIQVHNNWVESGGKINSNWLKNNRIKLPVQYIKNKIWWYGWEEIVYIIYVESKQAVFICWSGCLAWDSKRHRFSKKTDQKSIQMNCSRSIFVVVQVYWGYWLYQRKYHTFVYQLFDSKDQNIQLFMG